MYVGVGDIRKSKGLSKSFTWTGDLELTGINLAGPVELDLSVTNAGSRIMVIGSVQTRVRVACSRCSEDVVLPVDVQLEEEFLPGSSEEARERTSDPLDAPLTFENDRVELDELLRQEIEAAEPMQVLCRPACKGLCEHCGANLNHEACRCQPESGDERWAALKKWTGEAPAPSAAPTVKKISKN